MAEAVSATFCERIAFNAIVLDSENCQFSEHNEDNALNARSMAIPSTWVWLTGGLSVFVCCVGMAVPLNRTGYSSPPLFFGGGNNSGNIATQPNKSSYYEKNAFL